MSELGGHVSCQDSEFVHSEVSFRGHRAVRGSPDLRNRRLSRRCKKGKGKSAARMDACPVPAELPDRIAGTLSKTSGYNFRHLLLNGRMPRLGHSTHVVQQKTVCVEC